MLTVKNARGSDSHSGSMFAGLDKSCKMLGFDFFQNSQTFSLILHLIFSYKFIYFIDKICV